MQWVALVLVAVACVPVPLCFIAWRAERMARDYMERRLTLDEKRLAGEQSVTASPDARPPLPADLAAIADRESEPWARDQVRAVIQDEYESRGDWDDVRNAFLGAT